MRTRRQILAATSGAVAASFAGCSVLSDDDPPPVELRGETFRTEGLWPSFNGHRANTGYSPTSTPLRSEPSVAWRAPVENGLGYPVVGSRRAYYPDGSVLRAVDVADGTERWDRTTVEPDEADDDRELGITTPPAHLHSVDIGDEPELVVVGVAGGRNELRAYTVEGDPAWQTPTPADGRLVGPPAYEPRTNRVCVGTTAERVLCIEARTGAIEWSRRVFGPVEGGPAVTEDSVVVATTAGEVYALSTDDGRGIWRGSLEFGTHCAPAMAGGLRLVLDNSGRLYGLDSGNVAWQNELGVGGYLYPGVTTDGARVYFVDHPDQVGGDELVAAHARTGEQVWSVDLDGHSRLATVVGDLVYVAGDDTVEAFAAGDVGTLERRLRWRWSVDGRVSGPIAAASGRLFLVTKNGDQHELVVLE